MTPLDWKQLFESKEFQQSNSYVKGDLGSVYKGETTTFKIWAPTAQRVKLNLYTTGSDIEDGACLLETLDMEKAEAGVYVLTVSKDLSGIYYTYEVTVDGIVNETADPYAKACGINGNRSMVVDMSKTNPENWEKDFFTSKVSPIIYELHIKDFSYSASSGIKESWRGKYLAFTQKDTTLFGEGKISTGVDYIKDLGISHVHLLPAFDFESIDESPVIKKEEESFNWGYDPQNFNVPEGSYSTNPYDGIVRIKEFKSMVEALHHSGIGVIMDVVYNHTYSLDSCFQKAVPYYYYRQDENGNPTDGSACGNETASDRQMFRQYMIDSVVYWAKEYHIDGFRFDLMGLHDVETMNQIRAELNKLPNGKSILMYGEPWSAEGSYVEKGFIPALKSNLSYLDKGISIFSDDTRDAIKGSALRIEEHGYVNGQTGLDNLIKEAVTGWGNRSQMINYVSAHDNQTLFDKLVDTMKSDQSYTCFDPRIVSANKLAATIYFTCQGAPFFQAGEEFGRTKMGDENSYCSSPKVNQLCWEQIKTNKELVSYYKELIQIRRQYSQFWKEDTQIEFLDSTIEGVISFILIHTNDMGVTSKAMITYNNGKATKVRLPEGKWNLLLSSVTNGLESGTIYENKIEVGELGAVVLLKEQ